jgi:hypothetical protein
LWIRIIAIAAVITGLTAACNLNSQQDQPAQNLSVINPVANRTPGTNDQTAMREQQTKQAGFDSASGGRTRQIITDDSAKLLKLASDLKAEVDKSSKDTLSLGVIRKAAEIEKLAHSVREKMKLTMGGN